MALSADNIEAVIRPELRQEFNSVKTEWFPRIDNPINAAYDRRTPGNYYIYNKILSLFTFC